MGNLSEDIQSTFKNDHVKALINIKYTANWLDSIGTELLKPYKISIQQYNISINLIVISDFFDFLFIFIKLFFAAIA